MPLCGEKEETEIITRSDRTRLARTWGINVENPLGIKRGTMPGYVPRFMSIGESFAYSDDGNIKRFTSGARPNSILTDKDRNRFKLLPHYRCRRQLVERDPEVRILSWMGQVNRIRNETRGEPFRLFGNDHRLGGEQFESQWKSAFGSLTIWCSLPKPGKGINPRCFLIVLLRICARISLSRTELFNYFCEQWHARRHARM